MLLKDFIKESVSSLLSLYPEEEARSMVMYYCTEVFGFPVYQHITEPTTEIPTELLDVALDDMRRLAASEPLQYVLGYTEFCGRRFAVDERALIPRAETEVLCIKAEEMVAAARRAEGATPLGSSSSGLTPPPLRGGPPEARESGVPENLPIFGVSTRVARPSGGTPSAPAPLRVLDLCTGSGCIAWTLALDIPGAEVVATDLSEEALELARSQFGKRDAIPGWTGRLPKRVIPPKFVRADLLDVEATVAAVPCGIDLLTANPPYVMVAEKAEMRQNVLGWEPHMAIFAPEEDPLVFHRAIAEVALRVLAPGGCGIVEINSELPDQTAEVFTAAGFADVRIIPDYFDRPRFVSFRRK